jgi:hypothetical protein
MSKSLEDEVSRVVASMDEQHIGQEQETPSTTDRDERPEETIHIHYFPDATIILKEEDQPWIVDSTPVLPQKTSFIPAYLICGLYLLCMLATLAFQLYCIGNPPTTIVTIISKTRRMSLSGALQLGRLLHSITISQSQTVSTTGKGHQDAKAAIGTVTMYNGQQTSQTVAQGTVFTGSDSVSIETTQNATIPPGNPSNGYGTATVNARAVEAGSKGNIQAGDVNTPIAIAMFVKNNQFTGGQDERDFQAVAQSDIDTTATPLKTAGAQSVAGAFQGQLKTDEHVFILPCSPTVTSDHLPGQEATQLNVTVSETCSAVAYNEVALQAQATAVLATQATQQGGAGYTLVGAIHLTILQVIVAHRTPSLVFSCWGAWVYGVTNAQQQLIKSLIAGKTKQQALDALTRLPGIQRARIRDVDDNTKLPSNPALIHLVILV